MTFSGGSLAPGATCTFSVALDVPTAVSNGVKPVNTTSQVTGLIDGFPVSGPPAMDTLGIDFLAFSKSFPSVARAGTVSTLSFTLENLSSTGSVNGLQFSDDLDAMITGLVATGLPVNGICGSGSILSGTGFLTLT